jgi:hypothetical protein
MGCEIKRVPLDFDWPKDKIWHGFINPHYKVCGVCDHGQTIARNQLERLSSMISWLGYSTMRGGHDWHPMFDSFMRPSPIDPKLFEVIDGLVRAGSVIKHKKHKYKGDREPEGLTGLGSGDDYSITLLLLEQAGLPLNWGICKACGGDNIDASVKAAYEAWKQTEPPTGPGYQIWETVSEGSPISPVFENIDAAVTWLVGGGYSRKAAEAFMKQGWVPSMVMINNPGEPLQIFENIESAGAFEKE